MDSCVLWNGAPQPGHLDPIDWPFFARDAEEIDIPRVIITLGPNEVTFAPLWELPIAQVATRMECLQLPPASLEDRLDRDRTP